MALPSKKPLAWAGAGARPRLLGRYHVLDEIGRNVVGPLYLARLEGPRGFQRWAAIRRVDKRHLDEDGYVQRFYERVRAGAKLLHPNVTALFDVGEEDGVPWVAMEYLHGERVEEAIGRLELADTPASWEIAARVIADAADGLHAVHSLRDQEGAPLGLLHGDLAPHSLAITFEGKTKIKGAFEPRVHGVLDPRKVPYAAPEQLFDGNVDARADVFALGVLLWELLAGKRLFARATDDETRAMIEASVVPPLGDLVDDVPTELDALVRRALMREPDARFPSARELSRELESLLVSKGVVARDDDVGRYLRTLFADRYADQEAALHAAADVTEVFRKSQQPHAARPMAALPDVSPKDAEIEETELMHRPPAPIPTAPFTAPLPRRAPEPDDDHTTAERPVVVAESARDAGSRPISGYTDEILADSGPTIPRNSKPLADTDEIPTITAPQSLFVAPVPPPPARPSSDELTLTAANASPPVRPPSTRPPPPSTRPPASMRPPAPSMRSPPASMRPPAPSMRAAPPKDLAGSTSRLIMPSSLDSEADVTESAIFVAPRIPAPTPPDLEALAIAPPRPRMPSFPDRPLLPSTPATGVNAYERNAPGQPPTIPPSAMPFAPTPSAPPAPRWDAPPSPFPSFAPPPAFTQPPTSRGPHAALSTQSLRAVLFPQDRARRAAVVSIVGFTGGALLFLVFFAVWRLSMNTTASTAATGAPPIAPTAPSVGATTATTPELTPSVTVAVTATQTAAVAPAVSVKAHPVPTIPTMDLSQPPPHHHHHGAAVHATSHATVHEPVHESSASGKTGYLTVMCKPDACDHVLDGGRDLGGSPLFHQEISAGKHTLTLRVDTTHAQKVVSVDIHEGQTVAIHPDVEP